MTKEIEGLLREIKGDPLFREHPLYFIGGTALSVYLDHRISYDIDIASTNPLPIAAIKSFAFPLKANYVPDRQRASNFRINRGEDLENFYMKFMLKGIKMEFVYFEDEIRRGILRGGKTQPYDKDSTLRILSLEDIISLKAIALFGRQKSRDLFDMAIILERDLISVEEFERIFSFSGNDTQTLLDYIQSFDIAKDDEGDASLDFLPHHNHYKEFSRLTQNQRFERCKKMFLNQYEEKQKEKFEQKHREVLRNQRINF